MNNAKKKEAERLAAERLAQSRVLPPAPPVLGRDAAAAKMAENLLGKTPTENHQFHVVPGESITTDVKQTVVIRAKPICWAIPTDEVLFSRFFSNFMRLRVMPWDDIYTTGSTYLPAARNTLHDLFLENSECEHLVMLDSDVLPPPDFLARLMAHNLPMVGGWYRKKADPYPPCVYDYEKTEVDGVHWWKGREQPGTGLERVDAAGAGCWLMRRDVAEALGKSPYSMQEGGEDMVLCKKLMDLGIPTFIDWTVACAHVGVAYA